VTEDCDACTAVQRQVPVVQAAFSPSAADVAAAMRLMTAYTEHQRQGHGAFIFEGKMIDAPTVLQVGARHLLHVGDRSHERHAASVHAL
jgi:citrate lyase beta subunit